MAKPPEWLDIAHVVKPYGVRGEIKVRPVTEDPLRLRELKSVSALLLNGEREDLQVDQVQLRKDGSVLAKFAGYDAPEPAGRLRGATLQVPYTEAKRKPGQVLYADLLGLRVVSEPGENLLGEVIDVLRAGQDLLLIKKPDDTEHYVPWVDEFVVAVDRDAGLVRLRLIEGLLD
jgi:16S rRNA processing protein RimM